MTRRPFLVLLSILTCGLAWGLIARRAAADSPPDAASLFGLNGVGFFHYRDQPEATASAQRKMDVLKQAGARWDRFDFWWSEIEPERGTWKWDKADWLVDFYTRNHIAMLPILSYSAAWMKQSPHTPQDYNEFADYVTHVVQRYKGRVRCWEVWNEPNIPTFWKPAPDPAAYTGMLKAAYAAAHKADPHCIVVGAAANETDINWLRDIARNGGIQAMDAVSIHPYSMADGPEEMDLARQLANVRTFLKAQGRPNLPIWITEMGWQASVDDEKAMDRASRYMAQSYVIAAAAGVSRLFWFNLQDWREGAHLEGWGLLSPEAKPKRTLNAYRALAARLDGAHYVGSLPLEGGVGYEFRRGERAVMVAWAHRGQRAPLQLLKAEVTDLYGKPVSAHLGRLELTESPVFIEGGSRAFMAKVGLDRDPPARQGNLLVNGELSEVDAKGDLYGWRQGMFYGGADKGTFGVETEGSGHPVTLKQTTDAFWQSMPVPAAPGERYTLTAEIRATEATGTNGVQILFLSGPGWGWRGGPTSATVTGTTAGWKSVTVEGTVPDDADVVRVNLVSKGNTGAVAFRHVRLIRQGN